LERIKRQLSVEPIAALARCALRCPPRAGITICSTTLALIVQSPEENHANRNPEHREGNYKAHSSTSFQENASRYKYQSYQYQDSQTRYGRRFQLALIKNCIQRNKYDEQDSYLSQRFPCQFRNAAQALPLTS
jgi:hypothetical protein